MPTSANRTINRQIRLEEGRLTAAQRTLARHQKQIEDAGENIAKKARAMQRFALKEYEITHLQTRLDALRRARTWEDYRKALDVTDKAAADAEAHRRIYVENYEWQAAQYRAHGGKVALRRAAKAEMEAQRWREEIIG